MNNSLSISEVERRLHSMLRVATIIEADHSSNRYRVQDGELESGWVFAATGNAMNVKTWLPYAVGEEVVMLCLSGEFQQGIIIAAFNTNENPAPDSNPNVWSITFGDSGKISYNASTGLMQLVAVGDIIASAGGSIMANADDSIIATAASSITATAGDSATIKAPSITLDGDVMVNGTVTSSTAVLAPLVTATAAPSGPIELSELGSAMDDHRHELHPDDPDDHAETGPPVSN